MAQPGNYTPISLYYSVTANNTPNTANLTNGELAINITDSKLFFKNNSGVLQTSYLKQVSGIDYTGATPIVTFSTTSGSSNSIVNTGGWSIVPTGTNLIFSYNGTNVGKLDSTGNLTVIGNVTAYGTI